MKAILALAWTMIMGGCALISPAAKETASGPEGLTAGPTYRGVNLSGAEFGQAIPGRLGVDYEYPTPGEVDYYRSKGMNTFRIPFQWERLQPKPSGPIDAAYGGPIDDIIVFATNAGASVIIEPQNFGSYYDKKVGSAAVPNAVFADLWSKLAAGYKDNPRVLFNLMNEPHDMPTEQWMSAANAAIAAIRAAGASNTILVPGNGWTGAHSWFDNWYGTPNAKVMLGIEDPEDNTLFEVHQYLDKDAGGEESKCVSATIGRERLQAFVGWLRDHGKKGFLGEFAAASNATCNAAVQDMLTYVHAQSDVVVGWLWWGGGPAWPANYRFALDPTRGGDRRQMQLLTPFLIAAQN